MNTERGAPVLSGVIGRLSAGVRSLRPATAARGADMVIASTLVGARVTTILSMLTVTQVMLQSSPRPGLYIATYAATIMSLVVISGLSLHRRRPLGPKGVAFEVIYDSALLLVSVATVPPDLRIGSWVGFGPGTALCAAVAAGVTLRWGSYFAVLAGIVFAYLAYVQPAMGEHGRAIVANVLTYLAWSMVGRITSRYLRRMARDADEARTTAGLLARKNAERRARTSIHDGVSLMSRLAAGSIPVDQQAAVVGQLERELQRMRSYLRQQGDDDEPLARAGPERRNSRLSDVIRDGARGFEDLGLEVCVDLVDDVEVDRVLGSTVEQALRTALLNVRWHAKASMVIVHADSDVDAGKWTLTVRDDGCGFDMDSTKLGVGLSLQLIDALDRVGAVGQVTSQASGGTTVTVTGPRL